MRAGLIQLTSSDDPGANLETTRALIAEAARGGATFVLTPEVTNCLSTSRSHQRNVLCLEKDDPTLAALQGDARALGIWILIGSLALKTHGQDGRFANRSFLVSPEGQIMARYDKIHMFDVNLGEEERFEESTGYRPGDQAVLAELPGCKLGMTICYDVRFPGLYRALAQAGADVITIPSAFAPSTGAAHWETLLRARAIETGAFILAPAQCGTHPASVGKARKTYGHSLAVSPWGEVLGDGGTMPGITLVDLNLELVREARHRIPALTHDRKFQDP